MLHLDKRDGIFSCGSVVWLPFLFWWSLPRRRYCEFDRSLERWRVVHSPFSIELHERSHSQLLGLCISSWRSLSSSFFLLFLNNSFWRTPFYFVTKKSHIFNRSTMHQMVLLILPLFWWFSRNTVLLLPWMTRSTQMVSSKEEINVIMRKIESNICYSSNKLIIILGLWVFDNGYVTDPNLGKGGNKKILNLSKVGWI